MTHICMALSAFIIASSSSGLVTASSSKETCEVLRGIENVKTTCSTGPTDADSECLLECASTGDFEIEDWRNLFCKTVDNTTSWYTKNDERVTLQMIKDENLCKSSSIESDMCEFRCCRAYLSALTPNPDQCDWPMCEALRGIENVHSTPCKVYTMYHNDGDCLLDRCASKGEFEVEDLASLFCETVGNTTFWYAKNHERFTLHRIKIEKLCKSCHPGYYFTFCRKI